MSFYIKREKPEPNLEHEIGLPIITCILGERDYNNGVLFYKLLHDIGDIVVYEYCSPIQRNWDAPINYVNEIGDNLVNFLIVGKNSINESDLCPIKANLIKYENHTSINGSRRFNLNPGIISAKGISLVSHKPSFRRRPICDKYWLEDQVYFIGTSVNLYEHTFPELKDINRVEIIINSIASILEDRP